MVVYITRAYSLFIDHYRPHLFCRRSPELVRKATEPGEPMKKPPEGISSPLYTKYHNEKLVSVIKIKYKHKNYCKTTNFI